MVIRSAGRHSDVGTGVNETGGRFRAVSGFRLARSLFRRRAIPRRVPGAPLNAGVGPLQQMVRVFMIVGLMSINTLFML